MIKKKKKMNVYKKRYNEKGKEMTKNESLWNKIYRRNKKKNETKENKIKYMFIN